MASVGFVPAAPTRLFAARLQARSRALAGVAGLPPGYSSLE